jgi:orotate phosphoribosyltransferase
VSQPDGLIGRHEETESKIKGDFHMESRMVKFYSKDSNLLAVHAIPGHFATSHSHINYYVDVTSVKTRAAEAREAAKVLYSKIPKTNYIDTIVCMDGTEVIGAFLSQEIERGGVLSTTNQHETTYIVSPEINNNNQMLFRDNNKNAILGKHVVLLLGTTTTGETIRRSLECIRYYGGIIEFVASIFGTVDEVDGVEVEHLFDNNDVINYEAYPAANCPFCKRGHRIEAMVNGFGYSKL